MKKIMALFLLFLLCVGLAACAKADVKEQMHDQAIGSQEARPEVPIGMETETDNPLLEILSRLLRDRGWHSFYNDGSYGTDGAHWWIEEDTEDTMTVMIATRYQWMYRINIWYIAPYAYVQVERALYAGDLFSTWQMQSEIYREYYISEAHEVLLVICDTWVPQEGSHKGHFIEFTIGKEGTGTVDGVPVTWRIRESEKTDPLYIEFYDYSGNLMGGVLAWRDVYALTAFTAGGVLDDVVYVMKSN